MPEHAIAQEEDELQAVRPPLPAFSQPWRRSHRFGVRSNERFQVTQGYLRILLKRAGIEIPLTSAWANKAERSASLRGA
jgi:hypothetical protein